jgi:hypothetical protein
MMNKRQADELTAKLAGDHFPLWSSPDRCGELAHALHGMSATELADAFGRVEAMLRALEGYAGETGDLAASLAFEAAKHKAERGRRACEGYGSEAGRDLGPCAVPNTYDGPDIL